MVGKTQRQRRYPLLMTSSPIVEQDSHKLRLWFPSLRAGCLSLTRQSPSLYANLAALKSRGWVL